MPPQIHKPHHPSDLHGRLSPRTPSTARNSSIKRNISQPNSTKCNKTQRFSIFFNHFAQARKLATRQSTRTRMSTESASQAQSAIGNWQLAIANGQSAHCPALVYTFCTSSLPSKPSTVFCSISVFSGDSATCCDGIIISSACANSIFAADRACRTFSKS